MRKNKRRPRVVVAGLGDTGVLTAIHLARHADVVGVSVKPALVSGKELGTRISRPDAWAREHWTSFDRFRGLDRVRTVHGMLTGVNLDSRRVYVQTEDGTTGTWDYDALVISTGVTNGFWRRPNMQSAQEIGAELREVHNQIAAADSVAVVGGGPAAVGSAGNVAATWPDKRVDLYFPGDRPLTTYPARVWSHVQRRLTDLGVGLHPGHRAIAPDGFGYDRITAGPLRWSTGQGATTADAVLWAIGRVRPNTEWLPTELLDDQGFVRVTPELRIPGRPGVFAVGDVAATDPLRGSARNNAHLLLARNVRAEFAGRPLRRFAPPSARWGSVLGVQSYGLETFTADGRAVRFPTWFLDWILNPFVRRVVYRSVRGASLSD